MSAFQDHHHHFHKLLRSLKSHKGLRSGSTRRPSDCSDCSTCSMPRSSSENSVRPALIRGRSDSSSSGELDPLRAHPPMYTSRAPFDAYKYIPGYGYEDGDDAYDAGEKYPRPHHSDAQHTSELRGARSMLNLKARNAWAFHEAVGGTALQIYDGFNFGFDADGQTTPLSMHTKYHQRRPPPEIIWSGPDELEGDSSSSSSSPSSSTAASPTTEGWSRPDAGVVTPRPNPVGFNEPDYFLKRGDWKRRGIVFSPAGHVEATADECFDFDTPL